MLDYFLVYFQVILLESISLITKFLTGRTARSQTEYYQRMLDLKTQSSYLQAVTHAGTCFCS